MEGGKKVEIGGGRVFILLGLDGRLVGVGG